MVLGLSGTYCSGKSEVGSFFKQRYGFSEIDVDSVGHEALTRQRDEVVKTFGEQVLSGDGTIERGKLGRLVFADRDRLSQLEAILHPEMVRIVSERVQQRRGERTLINAALLVYMGLDTLCDCVIRVDAPVLIRMFRARRRDRIGWRELLRRIRRQRALKFASERVDTYTVRNWQGKVRLERKLERLATTLGLAE